MNLGKLFYELDNTETIYYDSNDRWSDWLECIACLNELKFVSNIGCISLCPTRTENELNVVIVLTDSLKNVTLSSIQISRVLDALQIIYQHSWSREEFTGYLKEHFKIIVS